MTKVIDFATEFNVLKLVFSHLLIYEDTRAAKSLLVSLLLDGFYEEWVFLRRITIEKECDYRY